MAQDNWTTGILSGTGTRPLKQYVSGWNVRDLTAAGTASVFSIRDSLSLPPAPSMLESAVAGNPTAGVHYAVVTWVTQNGEGVAGAVSSSINLAGSFIVTVTIPTWTSLTVVGKTGSYLSDPDFVVGRNVYVTKAGAPAAATTPTNAQLFLTVANPSTTIAAASNALPLPQATINVASTTGFSAVNPSFVVVTTGLGPQVVQYTGTTGTTFTGCTGGAGVMATGGAVTQPLVADNVTTTYSWNTVDGSLTATNPPSIDRTGSVLVPLGMPASGTTKVGAVGDDTGPNVFKLYGDGGAYMDVVSGAITWTIRGG